MSNMGYVKALTVTKMQIIIIMIGCRIGQSCKIRCDVLIHVGVGEPSRSRNIPNSKVSRGLLGIAAKMGIIGSCATEIGAQLAANMLMSRPLPNPWVVPTLLPIVWPLVCSRLTHILVSVAVAIRMPIISRATPTAAKVGVVMRHNMMSRGLWCWQQWWLLRQRRRQ
jgi:hypothetical protein